MHTQDAIPPLFVHQNIQELFHSLKGTMCSFEGYKQYQILRLCLVTVFVFYFQKLVFENIKKKQFSCIFEIKNMFG